MNWIDTILSDIAEALGLLTRLPVRLWRDPRGAEAVWAYPLAGLVVGLIACGVALGAQTLGLPALATALVAILVMTALTGALHEDGLADWADALGARGGAEVRLAVMKDSHIGAFGVIALIASIGLRASLLAALPILPALLACTMLSRAVMTLPMALLRHARSDGLARLVGRPGITRCLMATTLGSLPVVGWLGVPALGVVSAALIAGSTPGLWARRRIGGQTGDILGATQQCAEIGALLALCAVLA